MGSLGAGSPPSHATTIVDSVRTGPVIMHAGQPCGWWLSSIRIMAAGHPVVAVGIEHQHVPASQRDPPDIVELQVRCRFIPVQGVHVEADSSGPVISTCEVCAAVLHHVPVAGTQTRLVSENQHTIASRSRPTKG